MGIFSTIKNAIFGHKAAAQPQQAPQSAPQVAPQGDMTAAPPPQAAPAAPVDIEAVLTEMGQGKNLNWRTSIVDLMKLVGMESSLDERKELARELGYTGALDGSAEMNLWLHKAVMKALADNGGKVPASMLD